MGDLSEPEPDEQLLVILSNTDDSYIFLTSKHKKYKSCLALDRSQIGLLINYYHSFTCG